MQVAHLWKSQGHLAPFLATSVQAAEAQIDVETGFPTALAEPGYLCCLLTPQIGQTPLVRWRRSKPVTQRQGGSGVHGQVDTKPCVWSVYYRLVFCGIYLVHDPTR